MEYLQGGRSLGWRQHIRGDIRVIDIPGSHHSTMSKPGVTRAPQQLRRQPHRWKCNQATPGAIIRVRELVMQNGAGISRKRGRAQSTQTSPQMATISTPLIEIDNNAKYRDRSKK
jgi:hypothetical protein